MVERLSEKRRRTIGWGVGKLWANDGQAIGKRLANDGRGRGVGQTVCKRWAESVGKRCVCIGFKSLPPFVGKVALGVFPNDG